MGVNLFVSAHKQSRMISTLACISYYAITSCLPSLVPRFSPSPCVCVKVGFLHAPLKRSVSVSQVLVSADENAACYCNLPEVC